MVFWANADGGVMGVSQVGGSDFDGFYAAQRWSGGQAAAGSVGGANAVYNWSSMGIMAWSKSITRTNGTISIQSLLEIDGELVVFGTLYDSFQNDPQSFALWFDTDGNLVAAREYGVLSQEQPIAASAWNGGLVLSSRGYGGEVWFAGTDGDGTLGTCAGDDGDRLSFYATANGVAVPVTFGSYLTASVSVVAEAGAWSAGSPNWSASCP
jgi:hypothetical protein